MSVVFDNADTDLVLYPTAQIQNEPLSDNDDSPFRTFEYITPKLNLQLRNYFTWCLGGPKG
jgi:hypothetical protein